MLTVQNATIQTMPTTQSPLGETEATTEATLLVLADALTWELLGTESVMGASDYWRSGHYDVWREDKWADDPDLPYSVSLGLREHTVHYDTLAAAKIACARHHATGEWE